MGLETARLDGPLGGAALERMAAAEDLRLRLDCRGVGATSDDGIALAIKLFYLDVGTALD